MKAPLHIPSHDPVIDCRIGCGACCIAPSISSPIPGLPNGKPAGVRCPHLTEKRECDLWGTSDYPDVCRRFQPQRWICGETKEEALERLAELEYLTRPDLKRNAEPNGDLA